MALPKAGVELVAEGLNEFVAALDKATAAVNRFGEQGSSGGKQFESGFGKVVTGALRKVGELGVEALLKAGQAVAGFVSDSIGLAGDFQAGMLEFQAVAGKEVDTKGLEKFHDLFISLGKELPVSTSDVQKAAIEMVKGGIDPATIAAGGLRQNIQFAAAAMGGDLVEAATISSKILGGWADANATAEEKATFLTHATDQLTKAANASSVDVHELSLGIFNAQGIAKTAGVSFDDLTTTLAALAPRFASSSEAGNSLKNVIARLQPQTKTAAGYMLDLGLITEDGGNKFFDANGKFVGFQQTAEILKASLVGLTEQQKTLYLQQIFGNDAMNAAATLADIGAAGYQSMADSLANANGVLDNAALKQQGYNTALENAKGSFEALQITVGEKLLPILTDLLNNVVAPAINAFTDWSSAILGASDPLQALIGSIDSILPGFAQFAHWIGDVIPPAIQFVTDHMDAFKGAAIALAAVLAGGLGIAAVVSLVTALLNPMTLIAAGVAALGAAWAANWGDIQGKTAAVWGVIQPLLQTAYDWVADNLPKAISILSKFWEDTLLPAIKTVANFFQDKVFPILETLAEVFIAAAIKEVEILAAAWENILWPALKAVWAFLDSFILPIMGALFNVMFAIAKKEVEALAGLWQKVLWPALQKVGDYISGTVIPTFQRIGDYLSATFGPILEKVTGWLDKVTGGFGGVSGAVETVIGWINDFADKISNLKLPDWLTPGSPTPLEIGLLGIGSALQKSVSPGLDVMQQGLRDIGAAFGETDLINTLQQLGEDAWAGFGEGLKNGVRSVIRIVNSTATTVEGAFQDAFGAHSPATLIIPIGESVTQGLMVGIQNLIPGLISLIDSTASGLIGALTKNREELSKQISQMADDLISQAKDLAANIQDAIADSFGATASIDRQLAKNLADVSKITDDFYRQYAEGALRQAEITARQFADPTQGAKFFQMRSKQIKEYIDLQEQLKNAETATDQALIKNQLNLINAAQQAEIDQFMSSSAAKGSPAQDLRDAITALFTGDLGGKLPGALENPLINQLMGLLSQLTAPASNPWAAPPASASQIYGQGAAQNSYYSTRTINMPVYTNQSPSVVQDSAAIAWASMP